MNTVATGIAPGETPYAPVNFQASRLSRASLEARANAGISLVTADGDKITLTANSSIHASLETYDYLGRIHGQTVAAHGEKLQLSTASGFAITVEGSLDEEELADINKLLDTIASISKDFLSGNSQAGLSHLAEIANLDSIASFEALLSYTRETSAFTASQVSSKDRARHDGGPAPHSIGFQASDSFVNRLARAAEKLASDEGHERIPKRFRQLFNKLAHHLPLDDHEQKLAEKIQSVHSQRNPGHHGDTSAREDS